MVAPKIINLSAVEKVSLNTEPYEYFVVKNFINKKYIDSIIADYPKVNKPGSVPLDITSYGKSFASLIAEMNGDEFRAVIEKKFSIDLTGRPTIFTARCRCRKSDGEVHTDTESKIITVLLYMNNNWESQGGNLRILRSKDVNDYVEEVPPKVGTLLVFKRSDNSFHGHLPFEGARRAIQMNWVTEQEFVNKEIRRHKISLFFKKLFG